MHKEKTDTVGSVLLYFLAFLVNQMVTFPHQIVTAFRQHMRLILRCHLNRQGFDHHISRIARWLSVISPMRYMPA
jgi:hypothetical protein